MSNTTRINREHSPQALHWATGSTRSSVITIVGYPIASIELSSKTNGTKIWFQGSNTGKDGSFGRVVQDTGAAVSAVFVRRTVTIVPVSPYAMMAGYLRAVMVSAQSSQDSTILLKG